MRCPKCHYLSFEPEPRCRNCGYDLGLSEPDAADGRPSTPPSLAQYLPEAGEESRVEPPVSRPARRRANVAAAGARAAARARALERDPADLFDSEGAAPDQPAAAELQTERPTGIRLVASAAPPAESASEPPPPAAPAFEPPAASVPLRMEPRPLAGAAPITSDLPLFVKRAPDAAADAGSPADARSAPVADARSDAPFDAPERVPAAAPPLVVQRRAPDTGRVAIQPARRPGQFERDFVADLERLEKVERAAAVAHQRAVREMRPAGLAAAGRRLQAALIDFSLLGSLGAAIAWLTVRWSGLDLSRALDLPLVPVAAFLALIAFGYLWLFTAAGGQTIGKMLSGIRVVRGGDPGETGTRAVTPGQALVRSAAQLPSVLAGGVGFAPALTSAGLALHDRLAGTRVVRE